MTYLVSSHGGGVNDDLISLYFQNICLAKCVLHPNMCDEDDDWGEGWAYVVKCLFLKCVFPY